MDEKELYDVVKSGNVLKLQSLVKPSPAEGADALAKCLEELTLRRVDFDIQLFCTDFIITNRKLKEISNQASKEKVIVERKRILTELIDKAIAMRNVDTVLLQLYRYIYRNIFVLKNIGSMSSYTTIPWEEVEFILAIFVCEQTKKEYIGQYFTLSFNNNNIRCYLKKFLKKLKHENLLGGRKSQQERCVNVQKLNAEFDDLYDNFHLMRSVYSLAHIFEYLSVLKDIEIQEEKGKCAIRRLLQIIGECCKNSIESPNFYDQTFEINTTRPNHKFQEVFKSFKKLRDNLSHYTTSQCVTMNYCQVHAQLQHFEDIVRYLLIAKRFEILAATQTPEDMANLMKTIQESDQIPFATIQNIILNCEDELVVRNMYFLFEFMCREKSFEEIKTFLESAHSIMFNPNVKNKINIQQVIYRIIDDAMDFKVIKRCNELVRVSLINTDEYKIRIIKDILDHYSMFKIDLYLQTAITNLTFDLLDISTKQFIDTRCYIDRNYPIVFDRALRNQIAHDNLILFECATIAAIYITAKKFAEGTMPDRGMNVVYLEIEPYFAEVTERYEIARSILEIQNDFFNACNEGVIKTIAEDISQGADPDGINLQGFTAMQVAAIDDNELIFDYLYSIIPQPAPRYSSSASYYGEE